MNKLPRMTLSKRLELGHRQYKELQESYKVKEGIVSHLMEKNNLLVERNKALEDDKRWLKQMCQELSTTARVRS